MNVLQAIEMVSNGDFDEKTRDILSVLWSIAKGCNYNCSYCFDAKGKFGQFSSADQLLLGAEKLFKLNRPAYHITLYGGEPTFHPNCLQLIEFIGKSKAEILLRLFTNGSQSTSFFEKMITSCRDINVGMIFSLHLEHAAIDHVINVIEMTAGGGVHVGVNFMFKPELRQRAREFVEELLKLRSRVPFFMNFVFPYTRDGVVGVGCEAADHDWCNANSQLFSEIPLPQYLKSPFFTRVQSNITLFRDGRYEALNPEQSLVMLNGSETPSYKNYYCCGGTNVIFVEDSGVIRSSVCEVSKVIGNLFTDQVSKLAANMRVVRCKNKRCSSIENIPLPKFRHEDMAEECIAAAKKRAMTYLMKPR